MTMPKFKPLSRCPRGMDESTFECLAEARFHKMRCVGRMVVVEWALWSLEREPLFEPKHWDWIRARCLLNHTIKHVMVYKNIQTQALSIACYNTTYLYREGGGSTVCELDPL